MKALGTCALLAVIVSFVCWLINWTYWNVLFDKMATGDGMRMIAKGCGFIEMVALFAAVAFAAMALIAGPPKDSHRN